MRAREYLFEDSRTTVQKLEELIAHPDTEETIRSVARSRLALLREKTPPKPSRVMTATTNISEEDMDKQYLPGVTLGAIYDKLCRLEPSPTEIHFGAAGKIRFAVKPPFMGKTRSQYVSEISQACPWARNIDGHMLGDGQGYLFVLSML